MKLPFHGVQVCGDVFFAARGGNIHSFSTNGTHISCWKYPVEAKPESNGQHAQPAATQNDEVDDTDGRPAKRVKLENGDKAEADPSKKEVDEAEPKKKGKKQRGKGKQQQGHSNIPPPSERPMVIIMASTHNDNASHVIAVTSDKSIWVFAHDGRGVLTQLSRRTMPKRPCSIVLTPDNKDILSADKFGDVYAMPLLPTENPTTQPPPSSTATSPAPPTASAAPSPPPAADSPAAFVSQATALTVHTARNRKALNDQYVSATNPKAWRGTPKRVLESFERHLLLGHVSLLTAIALGHDAAGRPYILTADRDEHIRVSRGTRAQAHVVERFCMGHEQFVNRLLVGPTGLLLSGGGDDEVFVWRWLEGALLARVDVLGRAREVVAGAERVAVTGLSFWPGGEEDGARVVVFCERVPATFLFSLKDSGTLEFSRTINLPGNPFEAGVVDDKTLIVAVDPSHKEAGEYDVKSSLLRIEYASGDYQISEDVAKDFGGVDTENWFNEDISSDECEKMLYSAEVLRKVHGEERGHADEVKDEPAIEDAPVSKDELEVTEEVAV